MDTLTAKVIEILYSSAFTYGGVCTCALHLWIRNLWYLNRTRNG